MGSFSFLMRVPRPGSEHREAAGQAEEGGNLEKGLGGWELSCLPEQNKPLSDSSSWEQNSISSSSSRAALGALGGFLALGRALQCSHPHAGLE